MIERAPTRPKRMWEVLNVIPIIEVSSLSLEERKALEAKSIRDLKRQIHFQASLNQTPEEFFGRGKTDPPQK